MNAPEWLDKNTIFEALVGSHCYGLARPDSDRDYRGVCVAPIEEYLGLPPGFDQHADEGVDRVIYDVRKIVALAVENNPNIMDLLFMEGGWCRRSNRRGCCRSGQGNRPG